MHDAVSSENDSVTCHAKITYDVKYLTADHEQRTWKENFFRVNARLVMGLSVIHSTISTLSKSIIASAVNVWKVDVYFITR